MYLKRKKEFSEASDARYNKEADATPEGEAIADELNNSDTPDKS